MRVHQKSLDRIGNEVRFAAARRAGNTRTKARTDVSAAIPDRLAGVMATGYSARSSVLWRPVR